MKKCVGVFILLEESFKIKWYDVDLFGEETEEEKKAAEERAAAVKASAKKKECEFLSCH